MHDVLQTRQTQPVTTSWQPQLVRGSLSMLHIPSRINHIQTPATRCTQTLIDYSESTSPPSRIGLQRLTHTIQRNDCLCFSSPSNRCDDHCSNLTCTHGEQAALTPRPQSLCIDASWNTRAEPISHGHGLMRLSSDSRIAPI